MSKTAQYRCDNGCGKTTTDQFGTPGWVSFGEEGISIRVGSPGGQKRVALGDDYCSDVCFRQAIDKAIAKATTSV